MGDLSSDPMLRLSWASAFLFGAGVVATVTLRLLRGNTPRIQEMVWWAVLLHGMMLFHVTFAIPWYAPEPTRRGNAIELSAVSQSDWHATIANVDAPIDRTPSAMGQSGLANAAAIQSRVFHWKFVVAAAWLGGVLLVFVQWIRGYLSFLRCCRSWSCDRRDWTEQWDALLRSAGVEQAIPLHLGYGVGPALYWHPTGYRLIVPVHLWKQLSGAQRHFVMRHELAHYLRGDIWRLLFARLLALPHWFNPMAWSALRGIELATEFACDDLASQGEDGASIDYAKALLTIGESQCRPPAWTTAGGGGCLSKRVSRVLSSSYTKDSRMKNSLVLAVSLFAALAALVRIDLVAQAGPLQDDETAAAAAPDSEDAEQLLKPIRELAQQEPVPFKDLEAIAAQAANSRDAGTIYAEVAGIYHEHGSPLPTIAWALSALRTSLTPVERLRMHQYWGQAVVRYDREHAPRRSGFHLLSIPWPVVLGLIEASQYRIPVEGLDASSAKQLADRFGGADASWILDQSRDLSDARDAIVAIIAPAESERPGIRRWNLEMNLALKRLLLCDCFLEGGARSWETPLWLSEGRSFACTFGIDYARLLEDVTPVVDVAVGAAGALDEILTSLKHDSDGPQFDLKGELVPCLGRSTTFVADCQEPLHERRERHLLAIELTSPQQVALMLDRCFAKDRDSRQIEKEGVKVWVTPTGAEGIDHAYCVAHNHLIVSSDVDLLVETVRRAK